MLLLIEFIPEIIVNFLEAFLLFYLILNFSTFKNISILKYFYLFSYCALLCFVNLQIESTVLSRILLLSINVFLIYFFTYSSLLQCIFLAGSYSFITFTSENIAFLVFHFIFRKNVGEILSPSLDRYLAAIFYLIFIFLFVLCVIHLKKYTILLPKWMIITYFFIIMLGICSSESLFNVLSQLEYSVNLSNTTLPFMLVTLSLLFALLMLYVLIVYTGILYKRNISFLKTQGEYELADRKFQSLLETNTVLHTWKHEHINHLLICRQMLEHQQYDPCLKYLSDMLVTLDNSFLNIQTGNLIIDTVLSVKLSIAEQEHIPVERNIFIPAKLSLPLDMISLSSILCNALDNAIEACSQVFKSGGSPWLHITLKVLRESFLIEVENSSPGNYRFSDSHTLLTTKENRLQEHGYGLKQICSLVESTGGYCEIHPYSNRFLLTIIIPLRLSES